MIFIFFSFSGVFKKTLATNTSKLLHPMTTYISNNNNNKYNKLLVSNNLYWQRQLQTTPRQISQIEPYHKFRYVIIYYEFIDYMSAFCRVNYDRMATTTKSLSNNF